MHCARATMLLGVVTRAAECTSLSGTDLTLTYSARTSDLMLGFSR
jgi:hypothetical protein